MKTGDTTRARVSKISSAGASDVTAIPAVHGADVLLDGVVRRYGHGQHSAVLGPLNLRIGAGQRVALTGGPGSGKSEILSLIAGLDVPDEGSVIVGDTRVDRLSAPRRAAHRSQIGWLSQDDHLWDTHSAVDNVIIPVLPYRTRFNPRQRAHELLDHMGLRDRRDHDRRPVAALTGAQRQQVLLARAVISDPMVLLVDEPTAGLDEQTGADLLGLLIALHREHRMTLVVASEQLTVVARFHPVIMIKDGRIDSERTDSSDPSTVLDWVKRPAPPT